jgi:hypothetical protein
MEGVSLRGFTQIKRGHSEFAFRTALPGLPRGVEEDLPAVGGSRSNVLRCRSVLNIGQELDINATVLGSSF